MSMMGHNDGASDLNMSDSFTGRKLKPLVPRPMTASNNIINPSSSINPPCVSSHHVHGTDHFFSLNHHLGSVAEQSKMEFNAQPVLLSSRWNPTPDQLRTLEELYRRGTRTPSAEQIQHITAQLSRYGKIEGKNVFYWFQNHKARERQKRRRQMEADATDEQQKDIECPEKKDSGARRTCFEVEQAKNWALSTNSSAQKEESNSIQRASKAAAIMPECKTDGWVQFDGGELQQRWNFMEKNATWAMMQLSCHPLTNATHPIKIIPATATTSVTKVDPKLSRTHKLENGINLFNHAANNEDNAYGKSQTLELFPLRSCDHKDTNEGAPPASNATTINSSNDFMTTPHQYYEFLPLKK